MELTCLVRCPSVDVLLRTKELAQRRINPNEMIERTLLAFPGGVEQRETSYHVVGDYFDSIDLINNDELSFELVFHIKEDVTSFWKDMILRMLRSIGAEHRFLGGRDVVFEFHPREKSDK